MAEWNKCWGGVRILKNDGLVDEYPKEHQDPGGPVPYMVLWCLLNFIKALSRCALLKARYSVEDPFFEILRFGLRLNFELVSDPGLSEPGYSEDGYSEVTWNPVTPNTTILWMERRNDEWKDGTKTDNGICIQTMPTRNFTFSMGLLIDT